MNPFPYQIEGVKFLAGRRRALLFDAPGLGKTCQAIWAAQATNNGWFTSVSPASVVTQWDSEFKKHMIPESFHNHHSYDAARDKGLPKEIGVLTLDEVHFLKNPNAKRTNAVLGTKPYGTDGHAIRADYVWCLSGTPSPHDPSDLYPVLLGVVPGALHQNGRIMDYWSFRKRYCIMYDGGFGMIVKGGKNLDELADRIAPYMLRRTKKDVMKDWKEPVITTLELDGEVSLDHSTEEALAITKALNKDGWDGVAALAEADKKGVSRYRRYIGMLKVEPAVRWLLDQFDCGLEKIVIICHHHEVMKELQKDLEQNEIKSTMYHGGMTAAQKDFSKNEFINERGMKAFIGQIQACGTGLDGLQHATGDILFVEYSWIADENYQAICRLDRVGQENPVLARFVTFPGSLDDAITAAAARRTVEQMQLYG